MRTRALKAPRSLLVTKFSAFVFFKVKMILVVVCLFLVVLSVSSTNQVVEKSCPSGAVKIAGPELFRVLGDSCYLFMTYDGETYENTRLKCQQHGGTLAMPKTKDINDFLLQGMKLLDQADPMWIGVQYKATEDRLVWGDGEEVQWDNLDNKTRQELTDGGNCVVLHPGNARWRAHPCSAGAWYSSHLPFICQYPNLNQDHVRQRGGDGTDTDLTVQGDDDIDDICPTFNCPDLDCGMVGFKLEAGCQICRCNS